MIMWKRQVNNEGILKQVLVSPNYDSIKEERLGLLGM